MLKGEAANTNCIVFGLTRSGLEPTIYRTRGEHANHYGTDAVYHFLLFLILAIVSWIYSVYSNNLSFIISPRLQMISH